MEYNHTEYIKKVYKKAGYSRDERHVDMSLDKMEEERQGLVFSINKREKVEHKLEKEEKKREKKEKKLEKKIEKKEKKLEKKREKAKEKEEWEKGIEFIGKK